MKRRTFIKTGIAGSVLLGAAGLVTRNVFWGPGTNSGQAAGRKFHFFTRNDYAMLTAVVPAILGDALPKEERSRWIDETIATMDSAVSHFQLEVQAEVRQLFALLALMPTKIMTTGVWSSWQNASPAEIDRFLNRWQLSASSLFRTGYDALQQLTAGSWYGNPKSWEVIGYPGPPVFQTPVGGGK